MVPHILRFVATYFIYATQFFPAAVGFTLYPILYGINGFSEDQLSILQLATIPWCLKFVFGYIFESIWRPPRIFIAILHFVICCLVAALRWIPLENVEGTCGLFVVLTLFVVAHDVAFDGIMIVNYKSGLLLNFLQQLGYYSMTTLLSFVASDFHPNIFIIAACVSLLACPLFWIFEWDNSPLISFKGLLDDLKKSVFPIIFSTIYFLLSMFTESMSAYFAADITTSDSSASTVMGFYNVGLFVGIAFGQFFFMKLEYYISLIIALGIESVGSFFFFPLSNTTPQGTIIACFLLLGLFTSATDSILQCYLVDCSKLSHTPTFSYSIFQSFFEAGMTVGYTLYPQLKKLFSWRNFWLTNFFCGVVLLVVFCLIFFLVKTLKEDLILNQHPTTEFDCLNIQVSNENEEEEDVDNPLLD